MSGKASPTNEMGAVGSLQGDRVATPDSSSLDLHKAVEAARRDILPMLSALAERALRASERIIQDSCTAKDIADARALLSTISTREEVIEQCAKVADGMFNEHPFTMGYLASSGVATSNEIAKRIRSLK